MTARQIKRRLAEKNLTQAEVARRCKVSANAVHLYIHGKTTSARIEKTIAQLLGIERMQLRGEEKAAPAALEA